MIVQEAEPNTKGKPVTLPWSATVAVLIAFAALYISGSYGETRSGAPVLVVLGICLLATYVIPFRYRAHPAVTWTIRIAVYSLVIAANTYRFALNNGHIFLFDPQFIMTVGQIFAAELVIANWQKRPDRSPTPATIFYSALILLWAATTFDSEYIRWFAPAFILFSALSFPHYRPQQRTHSAKNLHWPTLFLRIAAIMLALGIGQLGNYELTLHNDSINAWGNRLLPTKRVPETTGISTSPAMGSLFGQDGTPTRVLRIENWAGDAHLRGLTFENYSHGRWGPDATGRKLSPASPGDLHANARGPRAHFTCLSDGLDYLLMPLNAQGIDPGPDLAVEWDKSRGDSLHSGTTVPYRYDEIQGTEGKPGFVSQILSPDERARCLAVPDEIDPRVRRIAKEIVKNAGADPAYRIDLVENYLISHHGYSLNYQMGLGDPISDFLLSDKPAHCQFFAASTTMLLRCLGIPTRYVTGYYAHEGEGPGATVVRQHDSHAWAESWIDGVGWVTVDATPGGGRPDRIYPPVPLWQKSIEWLQDRTQAIRDWVAQFSALQIGSALALAALTYLVWQWRKARRKGPQRAAGAFAYAAPGQELQAVARQFEELLRRRGIPCPPDRTWREHLAALPPETALLEQGVAEEFIRRYNGLRFGIGSDPQRIAELHERLRRLEQMEPTITQKTTPS